MYLKQKDIFRAMNTSFVKKIMNVLSTESYEQGNLLFQQGDPANQFYILLNGRIKQVLGETGQTVFIVSHAGEAFGWSILIDRDTLWLVHIFTHTSDLLGYEDYRKFYAKRKAGGQALLDEALQELSNTRLDVREELQEGPEAESILYIAKNCQADLIVMGTRGFGTLKGLLVGSISRKVMHHSSCPVMVVH